MALNRAEDVVVKLGPGELDPKAEALAASDTASTKGWKKPAILASAAIVVVVVGLALGLGLGLGLKKDEDGASSSATVQGSDDLTLFSSLPTHYIAADMIQWDYAEGGMNNCVDQALMANVSGLDNPKRSIPMSNVGGTFVKAVYREYTDATFTVLKTQPEYLGLFGPVLHTEAGSSVRIIFKNNLKFAVNLEPLSDITWIVPGSGALPAVQPGQIKLIVWQVPEDVLRLPAAGIKPGFQSSKLVLFHSSVDPLEHNNAGLVGGIIVTAKGQANADGTTKGVDRDIVTLFQANDERQSKFAITNSQDPALANVSYTKMAVNGYTWCSLPGLEVNMGEKVRWHVASIGNALNVHNFHWHGQTFLHDGKRVDHVNLVGASTASLDATIDAPPGKWLFHCHLNSHMEQGMMATYTVKGGSAPALVPAPGGVVRTYYIAAEEVDPWDYAPMGGEMCSGELQPFGTDASVFLGPPEGIRVGSNYTKAVYVEYTDGNFTKKVTRSASEQYLGMIGPIIRANVGDVIKVVFSNKARYEFNMHPHGVLYDKANEGAPYKDGSNLHADDIVKPNSTYTYQWAVPERAGPGPADPSSIMWMYHSHVDEGQDTSAGLFGPIIISKAATKRAGATSANDILPDDVDEEAVVFFTVLDEALSRYSEYNVKKYIPDPEKWGLEEEEAGEAHSSDATTPSNSTTSSNTTISDKEEEEEEEIKELFENDEFLESSLKHMINGFMFCNNPKLEFTAGKRVRLHIMSLGSQEDMHAASIAGGLYQMLGAHRASVTILAGGMMSMDVVFTEPGQYKMSCRVNDHVLSGMEMLYTVKPAAAGPLALPGNATKTYYVAADPVTWDYAPQGYVQCGNQDLKFVTDQYVRKAFNRIGPQRLKAQYRAYIDASFSQLLPQEAYLGLLGPLITAEVGDVLQVVFKNNLNFSVSFSPDGGLVALHNVSQGAEVPPGGNFTYKWVVPKEAGPLTGDVSTVALPYLSDVDIPTHTSTGLVGVMAIGKKGSFKANGVTPSDADKLMVFMFNVFNEELSAFHQVNLNNSFTAEEQAQLTDTDAFSETNQMHSINGYMYCNMPAPKVAAGSTMRVLTVAFGSEEALHSPHFLGQPVRRQVAVPDTSIALLPTVTGVVDMTAATPGFWPITCAVPEHQAAGMIAQLQVTSTSRKLQ